MDDEDSEPFRWSDEPELEYKLLGWGCLLLLALPLAAAFYIAFRFCDHGCD